jgi:glycosyltransferase involved in cell wall biosynthesis
VTGLHFRPGDAADLANKVEWAWNHPLDLAKMGRAARAQYDTEYTAEKNYSLLIAIYQQAMAANIKPTLSVTQQPSDAQF